MRGSGTIIPADEALRAAQADAVRAHRDLTPYGIRVVLKAGGWHVDYRLRSPDEKGAALSGPPLAR